MPLKAVVVPAKNKPPLKRGAGGYYMEFSSCVELDAFVKDSIGIHARIPECAQAMVQR